MIEAFRATMYRGPIPHPEIIEGWEKQCPGAANRILTMAESQMAHRHKMEDTAVTGGTLRAKQGLWAGFTVTLCFLVASFVLILTGHDLAGGVIGTVDIVALASVFVIGQNAQQKERESKAKARQERTDDRSGAGKVEGLRQTEGL